MAEIKAERRQKDQAESGRVTQVQGLLFWRANRLEFSL
jgi:hypothetical protein